MNRYIWKDLIVIEKESASQWPCPFCFSGTLSLDKASIVDEKIYGDPPEDLWECKSRFRCLLVCKKCKKSVAVFGQGFYEQDRVPDLDSSPDEEGGYEYVYEWFYYIKPVYFQPPLHLIKIPQNCERAVREMIEEAFALYWNHLDSSANCLRRACERILDYLKIPDGKDLHHRIEDYKKQNPDLANRLLAIKWIGNEGSHQGNLAKDDLLDAFELLEDFLPEVFKKSRARLDQIQNQIIGQKAPRSKSKKK